MPRQPFVLTCRSCKDEITIHAAIGDITKWRQGMVIQKAMPYLSADEREMCISRICPICWDAMYGKEK